MTSLPKYLASALLVGVAFHSTAALSQQQQSLDQYPSFVEFTTLAPDGTQTVLRCGYSSPDGKTISFDAGFQEISSINQNRNTYARLQHIDNNVISTSPAPGGTLGLQLELVLDGGPITAKICQTDTDNDTISNCVPTNVTNPAAQVLADDRKLATQCMSLLQESTAQINASLASPEKTEAFKAGLRQKVAQLAAK